MCLKKFFWREFKLRVVERLRRKYPQMIDLGIVGEKLREKNSVVEFHFNAIDRFGNFFSELSGRAPGPNVGRTFDISFVVNFVEICASVGGKARALTVQDSETREGVVADGVTFLIPKFPSSHFDFVFCFSEFPNLFLEIPDRVFGYGCRAFCLQTSQVVVAREREGA